MIKTKRDLIARIVEKRDLTADKAGDLVDFILKEIRKSNKEGYSYVFRGFGAFNVTHCKAKVGRIINENRECRIPAHNAVKFKCYYKLPTE